MGRSSILESDPSDSTESTDYKDVYITGDADYLYLRVTLHSPSDLGIFYNNIFTDPDNDPATGYPFFGLGSEMLVQGGGGFQEKNGGFNEGEIEGLDFAQSPGGEGTDFELRISRKAKFVSDGQPVFIVFGTSNEGCASRWPKSPSLVKINRPSVSVSSRPTWNSRSLAERRPGTLPTSRSARVRRPSGSSIVETTPRGLFSTR